MSLTYHYHILGRAFAHAYPGDLVEDELVNLSRQHPGLIHTTKDGVWWIGEKVGGDIYGPVPAETKTVGGEDFSRIADFCASLPALVSQHHQLSPVGVWLIADQR